MASTLAAIQMTSGADVAKNLEQASKLIAEAALQGAKLIVLPEMFALMGIDQLAKVHTREALGAGPIQDFLSQQAQKQGVWLVGGTLPISYKDSSEKVYAACLFYNDQGVKIAGYNKIHLFDVNLCASGESYAESRTTAPGNEVVVVPTPFGKIGLAVCYDIRFPEMFQKMQDQGVEIVILPAAFTYPTGHAHWETLLRARAIENQVYLLAAAQTGMHENGRKTFGHSMLVDPWGVIKASLGEEAGVLLGKIDLAYLHQLRNEFPTLKHRRF